MRELVALACLAALVGAGAACTDAPTPEFARAKAAYESAMADTTDVTYAGKRWDDVLARLRAVPTSNAREKRIADQLAADIETTRARLAADLRASDKVADELLDLKSFPAPQPIQAADATDKQQARPARRTSATNSWRGNDAWMRAPRRSCPALHGGGGLHDAEQGRRAFQVRVRR